MNIIATELALGLEDFAKLHPDRADAIAQAIIGMMMSLRGAVTVEKPDPIHRALQSLREDLAKAFAGDDVLHLLQLIDELDALVGQWPASEINVKVWHDEFVTAAGNIQAMVR